MQHSYLNPTVGALRLFGAVQNYAWGKVGSASRIEPFLKELNSIQPLAEYWLGAHPKGSARVELPGGECVALGDFLPDYSELPFMLKVLSVNREFGLSIQTHPDSARARELHLSDPLNYPDPFHKPEVGVAITPVRILYGFKDRGSLLESFRRVPDLGRLVSRELLELVSRELAERDYQGAVRDLFTHFIRAEAGVVAQVVGAIRTRVGLAARAGSEEELMIRLAAKYGDSDVGLVALYLMNIVDLVPGSALFIGANIPHAYLEGDLVECMACSDNVIRAGLTTKFKDVNTLLATCRYDVVGAPALSLPKRVNGDLMSFDLPVAEFSLGVIQAGKAGGEITTDDGHVIALCLGEQAIVSSVDSGQSLTLQDGGAALLPRNSGVYRCIADSASVFVASGRAG